MSGVIRREKQIITRDRTHSRKWQRYEEEALVGFIKRNPDFEKPCARIYYTKFLFESRIDVDWKLVRCKVRNMRTSYRRAKEQEIDKLESNNWCADITRKQMLKSYWYLDEFDIIFPNEMDKCVNHYFDPIYDDDFSKSELFIDNSNKTSNNNFLHEGLSTEFSLSKSADREIRDSKNLFIIKEEQPTEIMDLYNEEENVSQHTFRNRSIPVRKWQRSEEVAIIAFLKRNRDFEKPTARIYYTKFIEESRIDIDWKRARSKVRNMRTTYRRAKEHDKKSRESTNFNVEKVLRDQILKMCWYVDEFEVLFPNEIYHKYSDQSMLDQEFSNDESYDLVDNSNNNFEINSLVEDDDSTTSASSGKVKDEIFTAQRNLFGLKEQNRDEDSIIKQQQFQLAKEMLEFEKEKFREEMRLKQKEIEVEEKLKVMEIEMKQRIALKELEIEEMLATRSGIENREYS